MKLMNWTENNQRKGSDMDLEAKLRGEIVSYAEKNHIEKVILFGSRARGSNHDRSDIDLAVQGGDIRTFKYDLEEHARTLLMFDVVDLAKPGLSGELLAEIERDGVRIL